MNRQTKQWASRFLAAAVLSLALVIQAFAATGRIAFSDLSTQVGQEFTVTMKFSSTDGQALGDTKVTMDYDASLLEYLGGSDNVSGGTGKLSFQGSPGGTEVAAQLRFKALRAGSATITVSDWEAYDSNGQALSDVRVGSSAISIQGLATSSEDALLQSLQISPGTLDPAFSPENENYRATVGLDTESLAISAIPNNEHATVVLEGDSGLVEGENTVVCRVTAENGSTVKNYTIVVNKIEGGENGGASNIPEELPEVLAEMSAPAKRVQIIRCPEDVTPPEGLVERELKIGDAKVSGWAPSQENNPSYCIFYGVNENGERNFYRYDMQESTIQRYFDDRADTMKELEETVSQYNELVDDYNRLKWIAIGVGGALGALALVFLILLIATKRSQENLGERSSRRKGPSGAPVKQMGREEQYLMDQESEEEEDYEEDFPDELPPEAYQPELAEDYEQEQSLEDPDDFYPEPLDEEPEEYHRQRPLGGQGGFHSRHATQGQYQGRQGREPGLVRQGQSGEESGNLRQGNQGRESGNLRQGNQDRESGNLRQGHQGGETGNARQRQPGGEAGPYRQRALAGGKEAYRQQHTGKGMPASPDRNRMRSPGLAQEAASMEKPGNSDDFEFFDLDE